MECGCTNLLQSNCQYSDSGRTQDEIKCSGSGVTSIEELDDIWSSINCPRVYSDILYDLPTPDGNILSYNSDNLPRIQSDIYNLITTYIGFGYDFTSNTNSNRYNSFQRKILDLCANTNVPGGCALYQNLLCPTYQRNTIEKNSSLNSLCGCYAPPKYNIDTLPDNTGINLNTECDPLCHLNGVSQKSNTCTGTIKSCSNAVCVIDDVNINLVNTENETAINQICADCNTPGSSCTCIISGVNIVDTLNNSGAGSNYNQYCSASSTCLRENENGDLEQVPCPQENDFGDNSISGISITVFIIFVILIIFIVIVIAIVISKNRNKY